MKHLFTTTAMLFSMTAFAQVGINNTSPKATLDITAKTSGTKPEGLIIPQLTGDQIRAATIATPTPVYGTAQKGLIVYASTADSTPAGATASITAPGYYYFDGSAWQKIATGNTLNTSLASGNIYIGNASNVATAVMPTGDVAISNTGATSIGAGKITTTHLANNAVTVAKLPTGATATTFLRGDGTWVTPADTNTTYTGSTSIGLNGTSFERAALTGDVTASSNSNATTIATNAVTTSKIADNAVTVAKLPTGATATTFLRGDGTWVTPTDTNTTYTGSTSIGLNGTSFERAALTGDVTASANNNATTIAANAVTSAKIADGAVTASKLNQMSATSGQVLGWNGSVWVPTNSDTTNDAWINDTTNGLVKLGTKADGTARAAGTDFVAKDNGQIGIGTSSPDASAALDVTSTNKGLLIPRIALNSTTDASTITSPAAGLLIYNTNTSLSDGAGIYFNSGSSASPSWAKLASNSSTAFIPALKLATKGNSTTVTTAGGVFSTLSLSNVSFNDGNYNSSSSTYTVPNSGYYQISAMLTASCNANGNNNGSIFILVNGTTYYSMSTFNNVAADNNNGGTITLPFNTGDTIKLTSQGCNGCNATQYYWKNPSMTIMKVSN